MDDRSRVRRVILLLGALALPPVVGQAVLFSAPVADPVPAADDPWVDFRFLMGAWVSDGKPEEGAGKFTLEPDLDGKVLVRRNLANVPPGRGRPARKHEDLMVVYREPGGKQFRASYFDSEGHVIQYAVSPLPEKKGLVFVSNPDQIGLRYRLTYTTIAGGKVAVKFELARPGKPDEFRTYLEGTVRRP
jgi:hypothetical protein